MKDITIEKFLKNLKNALDTSQVEVIDLWEADTCAIGIKKKNKMIYISTLLIIILKINLLDMILILK